MDQFETRTRECQRRLRRSDADGVVLFPSPNLYYLSGFHEEPGERHLLFFLAEDGDPAVVAPTMYDDQIREASWVEDLRLWDDGDDPRALVGEVAADLGLSDGRLLVDPTMWALFTQDLRTALPDAEFDLADDLMGGLRIRKDDAELDAMRRAAAVADEVARDVRALGADAVGLTERELARAIEERLDAAGGEGTSFDVIVGSGPNGAKPHHRHGDREIRAGDPVVLDFGCWLDRYPSDQTRTVVFAGDPPEGFADAFAAVRDAQEAAVQAVAPGVRAEEVDAAAREVIEERGYGDRFVHRTGHGVGLEVHERPYVVTGNETELEPGMAFSVEPGVYLPGEFGIRIEDLVVVTEDGYERLNDSPRGWRPDAP